MKVGTSKETPSQRTRVTITRKKEEEDSISWLRKKYLVRIGLSWGVRGVEAKVSYSMATVL